MRIGFKIEIGARQGTRGSFFFDCNVGGPGVLIRWRGKECWLGRDETGWVLVRG